MSIQPYKINISDNELELLQQKIKLSRLPANDIASEQWGEDNGVTNGFMRDTIDFWRKKYDWKAEEARLNELPQFMTQIDVDGFGALDIHFVHSKSAESKPVPLLFVHGWPGSFAEVEKLLPKLNEAGFHVVAPSLPGYGFSSYTDKKGFKPPQHAEVLHKVMLRLGYDKYVVQGGDWGSYMVRSIALKYPEHVKALHCNMIPMSKPSNIQEDHEYTRFEKTCLDRYQWFITTNIEYSQIQATKTRTLGFMLHDSPVAMLAWMADKLFLWSDNYPWTTTEIITWTLMHYFPGPTTSLVMYRENPGQDELENFAKFRVKVPSGVSAFPKELIMVPRCWAEATMNVVWWKDHPEGGGHFAAYEKPEEFAEDLIEFFRSVETLRLQLRDIIVSPSKDKIPRWHKEIEKPVESICGNPFILSSMVTYTNFSSVQLVQVAIAVLIASYTLKYLRKLHHARQMVKGLPKPPHSFLLGNIPAMAKVFAAYPSNIHPHAIMPYLQKKYSLPPIYYVDTWPFGYPICAIVDPDVAMQVTVQNSLPKHEALVDAIGPLTGYHSLVSIEGKEHRRWRNIFNPGFSHAHLMTLVDGIVDDGLNFMDILGKHAEVGDIFLLEEAATRLTVDIIVRVVLDVQMNVQTTENEFVSAFRHQMTWLPKGNDFNPFSILNPIRPLVNQLNKRKMDRYLGGILDDRFASSTHSNAREAKKKNARPVIDLALDAYAKEFGKSAAEGGKIDPAFRAAAMDHIKVFLFAGHDTTSSTICFAAYALSTHPDALAKVLKEYNDVFGSDVTQTAARIKQDPYLINKLPYTVAIIKETLRLWPPASSVRKGVPGFFLHYDGKQYPTEGFMTWPLLFALQHDPRYWPSPYSFIPERWLVEEGDPLYPVRGTWRPFEFGPRNCIGQELAMIEIKVILALILREFQFEAAYEELDSKRAKGGVTKTPEGERVYQVLIASAKPAEGMPVKVQRRK